MGSARWSPVTMFSCSLLLASIYYPPGDNHPLTGGVLFTLAAFTIGKIIIES